MKIIPAVEERLREEIRIAMAKNPVITVTAMQELLEKKFTRLFSRVYVNRMMHKVAGNAQQEVNMAKIEKRIAQTRATYAIARERLMSILYWNKDNGLPRPLARDIVEATKNLVMLDIAVMNAEVANGIYKNLDEAAAHRDYSALPEEQRKSIISAFGKWGLLPPGATAQLTERTITVHAPSTQQSGAGA